MEIWKSVVGYEGRYEVSNLGNVRSLPNRTRSGVRALSLNRFKTGYLYVNLYSGTSEKRKALVHRLVAEAFIGTAPEGSEVCHNDGNRSNNRVENLRYGTRIENQADRLLHGTSAIGEQNSAAKLNEEEVIAILSTDGTHSEVAAIYKVSPSLIAKIRRGEVWKHLTSKENK